MEQGYASGFRVVRLHTGDPSLFGAIFEQMAELQKRKIPYQIIPGVTAAFAAAAAMEIEYTLPEVSQTLILTRMAGRTPVPDSEKLETLAAHQTSMAIYLSVALIDSVMKILGKAYGNDAPCAVVFRASQPEEKVIVSTIQTMAENIKAEKITSHALIIVGKVLGVKKENAVQQSKLYDKTFFHGYRNGHRK